MALPLPWGNRCTLRIGDAPQWNDAANSYRSLLLMALPDKDRDEKDKQNKNN